MQTCDFETNAGECTNSASFKKAITSGPYWHGDDRFLHACADCAVRLRWVGMNRDEEVQLAST